MSYFYSTRGLRIIYLLLGLIAGLSAQAQTPGPEGLVPDSTELRVLRQFYHSTGGPQWRDNRGWLQGTTLADVGNWSHLQVADGDVVSLNMYVNNVTGQIPACLGELRGLRTLALWQNPLTGSIPPELGQLTNLHTLALQQNQLSGPVPNELANLTELRQINFYANAFTGPVPAWLGRFQHLTNLSLSSNQFSGPIPAELGQLTQLQNLELAVNRLTGPLPASLGQLQQLESLQLWQNAFRDSIPAAWGNLGRLQLLNLAQSELIGRLPAALGNLSALRSVSFYMNQLRGPLPAELGNWRNLTAAVFSWNQLAGPVPASWGGLQQLQELKLDHNLLTGPLPDMFGQLTALRELDANTNQLSGLLPASLGSCTQLYTLSLSRNQLSGPLPASLDAWTQLRYVFLDHNQFTGPLPAGWGNCTGMAYAELSDNQFSGPLPASWGNWRQVWRLNLENNRLSGPLPGEWATMQGLRQFAINNNRLTGPLPPALGAWRDLNYFDAARNQFSGPIPAAYKGLRSLYRLQLSQNRLSGPLPDSLSASFLNLDDNRLSGAVPATLRFYQLTVNHNELTSIPDYDSRLGWPVKEVHVSGNYLDFGSFEPNQWEPGVYQHWGYGQRTPGPADTLARPAGSFLTLTRTTGGQHNRYQWQRRQGSFWADVPGDTTLTLTLGQLDEYKEGEYRVQITNRWVPGITIYTKSVYVRVLPYPTLPLNEPVAGNCPVLEDALAPAPRTGADDLVNYVRTYTARTAFTDPAQLRAAGVDDVQVKTEYLDGLGRPVQTVLRQESPQRRDIVQPVAYDALGRQPRQYLPYTADPTTADAVGYRPNALAEQYAFYRGAAPNSSPSAAMQTATAGLPRTGVPWSETGFEASPLNRPLAQGNAGESWQLGGDHVLALEQRPNTETDSVQYWEPDYGTQREELKHQGAYAAGELWVQQSQDEQQRQTQTFTDKEGQLVLKKVETSRAGQTRSWQYTYYVYDDFGRLRAIVPPAAVTRLRKNPLGAWRLDGAGVERLLFRKHYDERGRLIEQKTPDTDGYTYAVYDALDRAILTQDVTQRARAEWTATHYDALGRVVYTALVRRPDLSREQLQTQANQATAAGTSLWEEPSATPVQPGRGYYTSRAFPALASGDELLTLAYYDSYDFNQDNTADAQYAAPTATELGCTPAEVPTADPRVTGQATRSEVRVLGTPAGEAGDWLVSTTFFDEKLRPIQVQSTNARGGQDVATTRYDFAGKALSSYATHTGPNHPLVAVREASTYDHAGRLLSSTQALDNQPATELARLTYNELGQVKQKLLGPGATGLQTVDYAYNIRVWLTDLNDVQQPDPRDLWSFRLSYDCGFQTPQFNGNIAGQSWRSASDGIERAYGYRYDALSRLQQGDFVARTSQSPTAGWGAERSNYRFSAASYDAAGNLLTLSRRGLVQAATRSTPARYAETDFLRYRYQAPAGEPISNRLQRVDDTAPAAASFGATQPARPDFTDGATAGRQSPDYTYDAAGSLTADANKGITQISYNHLRLPARIEWVSGDALEYRYSATGQKVAKLVLATGKPAVRTDYLGPWQYEADSLRWLSTGEGRALRTRTADAAGQVTFGFAYEYTLKDHLGNLRVAFREGKRSRYYAGLEADAQELRREQHEFDSASVSYPVRRHVTRQFARSGEGAAQLNAGGSQPVPFGPIKQLSVGRGDTLTVTAHGLYLEPARQPSWVLSLAGYVAGLVQQQPAGPLPSDGKGRVRVWPLLNIGLPLAGVVPQLAGGVPRAYLRVLVFNKDSVLTDTRTQQLTQAALGAYEPLQISLVVPEAGYATAYVATESEADVFFDDIEVEHGQGLQVQETHYDPYGVELAGLNTSSHGLRQLNQYTWNGKEKQTEFGLNWQDHGWRFYDPTLGRWVVVDPDAEEGDQEGWTTYQFGLDNAVRYNDLDGRQAGDGNGQAAKIQGAKQGAVDFILSATVGAAPLSPFNLYSAYTAATSGDYLPAASLLAPGLGIARAAAQFVTGNDQTKARIGTNVALSVLAVAAGGRASSAKATIGTSRALNKLSGSGPIKGVIEVSSNAKSTKAFNNHSPKGGSDFVYDPTTERMVVATKNSKGAGHTGLVRSMGAKDENVVGGRLQRGNDGTLQTNEHSGHYGTQWTEPIRNQFSQFLQTQTGQGSNHSPWAPSK